MSSCTTSGRKLARCSCCHLPPILPFQHSPVPAEQPGLLLQLLCSPPDAPAQIQVKDTRGMSSIVGTMHLWHSSGRSRTPLLGCQVVILEGQRVIIQNNQDVKVNKWVPLALLYCRVSAGSV